MGRRKSPINALVLAPLCLLSLTARVGSAQSSCSGCRVVVEHVANVGDTTGGPGFIGQLSTLVVAPDSTIVLTDMRDPGIKVYQWNGEFDRRPWGFGEGPGEYGTPARLLLRSGGTIEVFDGTLGRRTLYSSDFEVVETELFASGGSLRQIRVGDFYVIPRQVNGSESIGLPIHIYSEGGRLVRSFGADPPIRNLRDRLQFRRALAPATDSSFWTADLLRFRVQHWSLNGTLLQEFSREPPWFPPQDDLGMSPEGPLPWLNAIAVDHENGILWTATMVGKDGWESLPATPRLAGQPMLGVRVEEEIGFKSIIEAIDTSTGEVLARAEVDAYVKDFTGDGYLYAEARTPHGEPVVRIWRVSLVR